MVSILLPTRKRFNMFCKSIESLVINASDIKNFEILVAMDTDDSETIEQINQYSKDKPYIKCFFYERKKYSGLHHYINDLSKKAIGTSIFIWNDDVLMKSKNWDTIILNLHTTFCVLSPKVENMESYWKNQGVLFPIIPKKWIDVVGDWSPVHAVDSWTDLLSRKLNLLINVGDIVIYHDRHDKSGNNYDETYIEGRQELQHNCPPAQDQVDLLEVHYTKLLNYLTNNII